MSTVASGAQPCEKRRCGETVYQNFSIWNFEIHALQFMYNKCYAKIESGKSA